ncbi:MAG: hypothetical protein RBU30_27140, partial [Polyangia bacterium]|nr:hypothetical protein [Polyangia bacterium]
MMNHEETEPSLLPYVRLVKLHHSEEWDSVVDEYVCHRADVNLYMLLCRRHRHMRILDYRIGNYQLKRN